MLICRGSYHLNTACKRCSRCRLEYCNLNLKKTEDDWKVCYESPMYACGLKLRVYDDSVFIEDVDQDEVIVDGCKDAYQIEKLHDLLMEL